MSVPVHVQDSPNTRVAKAIRDEWMPTRGDQDCDMRMSQLVVTKWFTNGRADRRQPVSPQELSHGRAWSNSCQEFVLFPEQHGRFLQFL